MKKSSIETEIEIFMFQEIQTKLNQIEKLDSVQLVFSVYQFFCTPLSQNILMDENRCAKISNFGLAKIFMPDQSKTFIDFRGTRGYVAPEWHC